jgi:hypothetical protein
VDRAVERRAIQVPQTYAEPYPYAPFHPQELPKKTALRHVSPVGTISDDP